MKKLILSAVVIGLLSLMAGGKNPEDSLGLPSLHAIRTVVLSPNYGCRSSEDFSKGYESTALFLSDFAKRQNAPDLLFNGACGSEDYFEASTAGDDMSLIADLGVKVSLEDLSAHRAFNLQGVHSFPAYSKFARSVKVELDHTYAVLLNTREKRGLFVFTVTTHVPNKQVELRYAVESYQLVVGSQIESSAGFAWDKKNTF